MALFLITILSLWALMHLYVFWRLASIPWVATHISTWALVGMAVFLWSSYVLARILDSKGVHAVAWPLEYLAANWVGLLFLLLVMLLVADLITLGGRLFRSQAPTIRGWAALGAGLLAVVAFIQGLRAPVVRDYEVQLRGLPAERDGMVLVHISDLHLGNLIGETWLRNLEKRLGEMRPDLIVVVGDLVDGNVARVEPLRELLKEIKAPLGVWAVTGNHEFYAGLDRSVRLFQEVGLKVLRDSNAEVVPGVVMAGVDDLTARQQYGAGDHAMDKALANRPPGATILLSHSPLQAEKAAAAGVGLMLSGHTHQGQIWPFNHLVALRYPLIAGRYRVGDMSTIVCRGTGTWGPRMRLWRPSEIVRITLRATQPV